MLIYQMVNTDTTGKYYDLFPQPKGPPGRSKLTTSAWQPWWLAFLGKISFEDMGVEPRKW